MIEFRKEDIEKLDFIIDKVLENGYSDFGDLDKTETSDDFIRYLYILNEYGVCDCSFTEDMEFAKKNEKTKHFKLQGGFKSLYSESIKKSKLDNERNSLELENLKLQNENLEYQKSIRNMENKIRKLTTDNLRLGNWDIRFRWYIAIIGFLLGIITKYFMDK
ncbi:hypothetical protein [Polaribacter sp. R77954]|uniref:hypothetical protein n=1 Tax=Polaribacter sp. R77954 TaxID=3093870 RepID=UPI0037C8CC4D